MIGNNHFKTYLLCCCLAIIVLFPCQAIAFENEIKSIIIKRLNAQAERFELLPQTGAKLRAELLANKEEEAERIILEAVQKQNAYANLLKREWITKKRFNDLTQRGARREKKIQPFEVRMNCTFKYVEDSLEYNSNILRTTASKIENSSPRTVKEILKKLPGELSKLKENEKLIKGECDQGGVETFISDDKTVSVSWNSSCYADEENTSTDSNLTEPSVGALLYNNGAEGFTSFCSATLISPNMLITAAHCFCHTGSKNIGGTFYRTTSSCLRGSFWSKGSRRSTLDPRDHKAFFQHTGLHNIQKIIIHPQFRWTGRLPVADLALVVLEKPITDIPATPINTISRLNPNLRTQLTAAGFGYYRKIRSDGVPEKNLSVVEQSGLKFQGTVVSDFCSRQVYFNNMICWTYRRKLQGLFLGSTCKGDSGGPIFGVHQGKKYLVGVISAGGRNCLPGSRAYNFETFSFRRWILANIRAHQNYPTRENFSSARQLRCLFCPLCSKFLSKKSGRNNEEQEEDTQVEEDTVITIENPQTRRLRVSVNCSSGIFLEPLRLALKQVTSDSSTDINTKTNAFPCDVSSISSAQSCDVSVDNGQKWKVIIDGAEDRSCQIMATAFDN